MGGTLLWALQFQAAQMKVKSKGDRERNLWKDGEKIDASKWPARPSVGTDHTRRL